MSASKHKVKPVILDVDTGVDDALGIMLALNSPELDVRAITVCGGNNGLEQCAINTVRIVYFVKEKLNPDVAPPIVAKGLDPPEIDQGSPVHGNDGLGGVSNELSFKGERDQIRDNACIVVEQVLEQAEKNNEKITIVATGPQTNLAHWVQEIPKLLANNVGEVIVMGGAFRRPGNVTKNAEFNIWEDPVAASHAHSFFSNSARVPYTFVGLDVTQKVLLRTDELRRLQKEHPENNIVTFVRDLTRIYRDVCLNKRNLPGCAMHDPLAVVLAISPGFCETEPQHVKICTDGEMKGATVIEPETRQDVKGTTSICTSVDVPAFEKFFINRVTGIASDEHNIM